jgi:MoaA/NifB/PqqE/SkfB family radical SAM enzyme
MEAGMHKKIRLYLNYFKKVGINRAINQVGHKIWLKITKPVSLYKFPDKLHMEITHVCNLKCEYCQLGNDYAGDKIMSLETFDKILPYIKYMNSISISGLAEPLLNNNVFVIMEKIKSASKHVTIEMASNATMLTEKICKKLIELQLDNFTFSLDGFKPEIIDSIRIGGSTKDIIHNIRYFNQIKIAANSRSPSLAIAFVLQNKNCEQLPGVISLASELGVSTVYIHGLEPYFENLVSNQMWHDSKNTNILKILDEASLQATKHKINVILPRIIPTTPTCQSASYPVILSNGDVVPCSALAYSRNYFFKIDDNGQIIREKGITTKKVFGNINNSSLPKIWFSPEYTIFRTNIDNGNFNIECRQCLIKHGIICPNAPLSISEFGSQLKNLNSQS